MEDTSASKVNPKTGEETLLEIYAQAVEQGTTKDKPLELVSGNDENVSVVDHQAELAAVAV